MPTRKEEIRRKMESEIRKRSESDEREFQRAIQMRAEGDLKGAEKLLAGLAGRCPEDLLVRLILGGVLFNLDRYSEAIVAFRRVLSERPANEPSSLGLFHCLWHLGERREAIQEMERFLSIAKSDEYEKLRRDFERAIQLAEGES
jgi:predicted Zn-dependent protease